MVRCVAVAFFLDSATGRRTGRRLLGASIRARCFVWTVEALAAVWGARDAAAVDGCVPCRARLFLLALAYFVAPTCRARSIGTGAMDTPGLLAPANFYSRSMPLLGSRADSTVFEGQQQ